MSDQQTDTQDTQDPQDEGKAGGYMMGTDTAEGASGTETQQRDPDALPSPQEKYENYEADRKRLAKEHGQT